MLPQSRANLVILTVYLALIGALISGMVAARRGVLNQHDARASQAAWEQWRAEAERQADDQGPVKRRVPRATEAPTLLLLRDHFAACLTLALVISTVLFATLAFMIRGVLLGPRLQLPSDSLPKPDAPT